MTVIALIMVLLTPSKSHWWGTPVETADTCWSAHMMRVQRCRTQFPDSTSIQRAVCEADSAGQYVSCIGGLP